MVATLDIEAREILLGLARQALVVVVQGGELEPLSLDAVPEQLRAPGASFVTLLHHGKLRGCVGAVEAFRPIAEDVRQNTVAAAFSDPRFPRVETHELAGITLEIAILSPLQPVAYLDGEDLLRQIRPGVDGVLLVDGERRATFLPKVWDKIADPRLFLSMLCRKMGSSEDHWQKKPLAVYLYQTEEVT